ncbi:MAG TPA: tRNA (adenosine(37)-N6)-dimethylallyltransferase MiaA [Candidatus Scatosoma pullistercoris]|uniref:tRNA dimethylallyltransferase n=1 Tax=Candidatus Scatosoma pullistercoris TaxID=2840934 RepID=A0A9D1ME74_9FIRM|nr:tRNA (adenosine(37)-N6)-dimethylallyltransferase MiaA [Candidatus Scatosoma pullistercoris]
MRVLVICGPTASGKTSLAVECARALDTEIISADSMLVYKGLDIGTAKPSASERKGVVHHLIDVAEPTESFSVSDYERLALPVVQSLLSRGKTPVICGGTGFYINSVLYKSQFGKTGANPEIRKKYETYLEENGKERLHALLKECDPESASRLHPNDTKRVVRALEIFETTGRKKSDQHDLPVPRFDFVCVSVGYPREELYERINRRVDGMLNAGLAEEVRSLLERGIPLSAQCMQGIGYKEMAEGMRQGWPMTEIAELIKKNTRNYAKRQITFFRRMNNHTVLSPEHATAEEVLKLL